MKKSIFSILIAFISFAASAQEFKGLDNIPMKTDADFRQAESTIKDCVKYILGHPISSDDVSGKNASRFLIIWMTGTPDYSFAVDADFVKYSKKNEGLTAVIMAAMAKAVLDKPELNKDPKALKIAAFKLVAEYCADSKNKVTQTSDIKKLIDANKKGKLEGVLDMTTGK